MRSDAAVTIPLWLGAKGEQLRTVPTKPAALLAPARAMSIDKPPETWRVAANLQMAELVNDDVAEDGGRRQHEPPVERQGAARRARPPQRPLCANSNALVADANARRLLVG
jgi:hypothetical protein